MRRSSTKFGLVLSAAALSFVLFVLPLHHHARAETLDVKAACPLCAYHVSGNAQAAKPADRAAETPLVAAASRAVATSDIVVLDFFCNAATPRAPPIA